MVGKLSHRISFQLVRLAIIIALFVGVVFAVGQIYLDFMDEEASRDAHINEVMAVASPAATRAVRRLDQHLAKEVALGLVEHDFIISVNILDDMNRTMASVAKQEVNNSKTRWLTRLFSDEIVEVTKEITLDDPSHIGRMVVVADNDIFMSPFYDRSIVILASEFFQTFSLAFLLMVAFHYVLSKPLSHLAEQLENIDPSNSKSAPIYVHDNHKNDELGHLAQAMNMMMGAINTLMEEQEDAQRRLSIAHDELEFRVNDRTAELKHEIRERLRAEELIKEANIQLEGRVEGRTKELSQEIDRHKTTLVELSDMKEAADSANRAKTSFLANMSHELRTPLNAIVGFTTIMDDEMFGPVGNKRYKQYIKDIQDSSTHLSEILGNILDLAKVEAGELHLNDEQVDVVKMVDSCSKMFVVMAAEVGIEISHSLGADLPLLLIDELRVKQIIINLISNSLKFTHKDGKITIDGSTNDRGGFTLCVEDTGDGIPNDKLEKVLEPFAQVEGSFERTYQGVGLGLSLSKSLAELHGGTLWIESELNAGTKVFVEFPEFRTVNEAQEA